MEDDSTREKRRIKILERLKKDQNYSEDSPETEIQSQEKNEGANLSAHEKYKLLKSSETKEVRLSFSQKPKINMWQRKIISISLLSSLYYVDFLEFFF